MSYRRECFEDVREHAAARHEAALSGMRSESSHSFKRGLHCLGEELVAGVRQGDGPHTRRVGGRYARRVLVELPGEEVLTRLVEDARAGLPGRKPHREGQALRAWARVAGVADGLEEGAEVQRLQAAAGSEERSGPGTCQQPSRRWAPSERAGGVVNPHGRRTVVQQDAEVVMRR